MRKIENRTNTQLRIDSALYAKLKAIADKEHRYVNSQIEYFIDIGIKTYESEHGPIQLPEQEED